MEKKQNRVRGYEFLEPTSQKVFTDIKGLLEKRHLSLNVFNFCVRLLKGYHKNRRKKKDQEVDCL